MGDLRVIYTPEAEMQLVGLYRYIAREASAQTATRFTDAIVARCDSLNRFPDRGTSRQDIRPGLRTLSFRRVVIAYDVDKAVVTIIGIFSGGQDFEAILRDD